MAKLYNIEVLEENQSILDSTIDTSKKIKPKASQLTWNKIEQEVEHGTYFIRTNIDSPNESQIWDTYNTIHEVESTFRCLKSQLRIQYQLKSQQINHDWKNILRIV